MILYYATPLIIYLAAAERITTRMAWMKTMQGAETGKHYTLLIVVQYNYMVIVISVTNIMERMERALYSCSVLRVSRPSR
jgi:hypothetical protein